MQNILRHEMTEYDSLLLRGEDRKTARKKVQPRINAILALWSKPAKAVSSDSPVGCKPPEAILFVDRFV
ncbi:DUF2293 domain-containing protein [Sinorhizobium medicae]|uniref:DUF2293 domain-containing protein n=1 Tax=Sinorhizobium medicae TaxID=110321 RepID=UPI002E106DB3